MLDRDLLFKLVTRVRRMLDESQAPAGPAPSETPSLSSLPPPPPPATAAEDIEAIKRAHAAELAKVEASKAAELAELRAALEAAHLERDAMRTERSKGGDGVHGEASATSTSDETVASESTAKASITKSANSQQSATEPAEEAGNQISTNLDNLIATLHEHNIDEGTIHEIVTACELDDGSIDDVHFEQLVKQVIEEVAQEATSLVVEVGGMAKEEEGEAEEAVAKEARAEDDGPRQKEGEEEDETHVDRSISSLHEHNIDEKTIHEIVAACELDDGSIDGVHFEQLVTLVVTQGTQQKAAAHEADVHGVGEVEQGENAYEVEGDDRVPNLPGLATVENIELDGRGAQDETVAEEALSPSGRKESVLDFIGRNSLHTSAHDGEASESEEGELTDSDSEDDE